MAWTLKDGQMVKVAGQMVKVNPAATPEVTLDIEVSEYVCAQCGREFKTAPGLARHTTTKHG